MRKKYSIILLSCLILFSCRALGFRPVLGDDKEYSVRNDRFFISSLNGDSPVYSVPGSDAASTNQGEGSPEELNSRALFLARNRFAEDALSIWQRKDSGIRKEISISNTVRLLYLLERFDEAKKELNEYFRENRTKDSMLSLRKIFSEPERNEESMIFFDVLKGFPEWELEALEELARFSLVQGDYSAARIFIERILSIYSFHKSGLRLAVQLSALEEKWAESVTYGDILIRADLGLGEAANSYLKSLYETGEYGKLQSLASRADRNQKKELLFWEVWRDSVLSISPKSSLSQIAKEYAEEDFSKTVKPEEFLPLQNKEQKLYLDTFRGF
ncbi:MAG TPA: hypothetical protein PL048_21055 [Leptospiraceae bacterium]|nr:hypothetical protein [Leptospiraceae bacterium]HMY66530.1 hypothetical protein [Leptospiraceae bacterium]HMZ61274.1 hypothetical protein [Leptospiraceae bacterium]HNF24559.1 hypothetical protein [Leptospiraceae bacterium]HNM04702.1 hypothetical protein [Leptospiraceae bacterium]